MKRYRVIIPPIIHDQIRAQVLYIAHDSIDNALLWEDRLRAAIKGIGELPGGYPIDNSATDRIGINVFKMVFEKKYLIHFTVDKAAATVEIVNFRHGARLPGMNEP